MHTTGTHTGRTRCHEAQDPSGGVEDSCGGWSKHRPGKGRAALPRAAATPRAGVQCLHPEPVGQRIAHRFRLYLSQPRPTACLPVETARQGNSLESCVVSVSQQYDLTCTDLRRTLLVSEEGPDMRPTISVLTKAARIETRVTADQKALFQRAAELTGRSLTDFILRSAQEVAVRTVREYEVLALSGQDRDRFVRALLKPPPPSQRLRQAARRYRRVVSR